MSYSILRPQTANFIFETPLTQPYCPRRPKRPVHNSTRPSQDPNELDTTGLAKSLDEAPASSSDRHDDQPSEINIIGDDDNVGGSSASIEDLFDIAGDDERTTDGDGRIPLEDQSSSLGQDDQAEDSDISLEPAPAETRNEIPRDYSARPGQARQDDQERPMVLDSRVSHGNHKDMPIIPDVDSSAVNFNSDRDSPLHLSNADKPSGLLNEHKTQPNTTECKDLRAASVDGNLPNISCVTCFESPVRRDDGNRCEGSRQLDPPPCFFDFGVGIETAPISEGAGEDITLRFPPAKRPRQDRSLDNRVDQPASTLEATPLAGSADPPDQCISRPLSTSITGGAQIPIRGHLSSKFFQSEVVYCLTFSQELSGLDSPERSVLGPPCRPEDRRDERHCSTRESTVGGEGKRSPYSSGEDALLVELKEKRGLTWTEIAKRFPDRTKGALQVRYCT